LLYRWVNIYVDKIYVEGCNACSYTVRNFVTGIY
jgi:hypothetical protein